LTASLSLNGVDYGNEIAVTQVAAPTLTSVLPAVAVSGAATTITLTGKFTKTPKSWCYWLDNDTGLRATTEATYVSGTSMTCLTPTLVPSLGNRVATTETLGGVSGLSQLIGQSTVQLRVSNIDQPDLARTAGTSIWSSAVTVVLASSPQVQAVVPNSVVATGGGTVTVYGTGFGFSTKGAAPATLSCLFTSVSSKTSPTLVAVTAVASTGVSFVTCLTPAVKFSADQAFMSFSVSVSVDGGISSFGSTAATLTVYTATQGCKGTSTTCSNNGKCSSSDPSTG